MHYVVLFPAVFLCFVVVLSCMLSLRVIYCAVSVCCFFSVVRVLRVFPFFVCL